MLTSAKIGKENGATRIRKPGYLNLSNETVNRNHRLAGCILFNNSNTK
jgi:hypothetical protein